jgi:hypothetical protein
MSVAHEVSQEQSCASASAMCHQATGVAREVCTTDADMDRRLAVTLQGPYGRVVLGSTY